jgi:[NiFe] hydrogenase diaphorase moiety large subunit
VGTPLMLRLMEKVEAGRAGRYDLQRLRELGAVLRSASHCELGHAAPGPVLDTLDRFPQAYEQRLKAQGFEPMFDLDGALARARAATGRDDAGAHLAQS